MAEIIQFPGDQRPSPNHIFSSNKYSFSADIEREQIRLSNSNKSVKTRYEIATGLADCLEENLANLLDTGDIETAAQTQIEVIAFLREYAN
ncbi:MAG: hypothetical protein KME68_20355 [Candidatus Thiodiazotropha sp. (ex Lucina pensylvanica)]|nr:hypothetical protein [Candidatus Thiodiazotropha sp. (ex Lucina pensylvanica)]